MDWDAQRWREVLQGLTGGFIVGLARHRGEAHVLSSPQRLAMYRLVLSKPGISLQELSRRLDTTWGSAKYHSVRLEAAGLIGTRVVGRHRVCFPVDASDEDLVDARGILAEPTARLIAGYILEHPGASIARVIADTRESQRVVYYHVKRFAETGLVDVGTRRGYRGLHPTAKLHAAFK